MNITRLINNTYETGGKVWLMADLHLLKKAKDLPRIIVNNNYSNYEKSVFGISGNDYEKSISDISDNDMLIFLGDFVDDTIPVSLFKTELEKFVSKFTGEKIWVRGNNDLFSADTYEEYGFKVCYAATAQIDNYTFVFSHTSIDVSKYKHVKVLHAHMHRNDNSEMLYYHDPVNNTNLAQNLLAKGYKQELRSAIYTATHVENKSRWFGGHEKIGMSMFIHNEEYAEMVRDLNEMEVTK